jgi:hypothetical protein
MNYVLLVLFLLTCCTAIYSYYFKDYNSAIAANLAKFKLTHLETLPPKLIGNLAFRNENQGFQLVRDRNFYVYRMVKFKSKSGNVGQARCQIKVESGIFISRIIWEKSFPSIRKTLLAGSV